VPLEAPILDIDEEVSNYYLRTILKSNVNSSYIILSPRLAKNLPEPYFTL
jgi:hypothetical protein